MTMVDRRPLITLVVLYSSLTLIGYVACVLLGEYLYYNQSLEFNPGVIFGTGYGVIGARFFCLIFLGAIMAGVGLYSMYPTKRAHSWRGWWYEWWDYLREGGPWREDWQPRKGANSLL